MKNHRLQHLKTPFTKLRTHVSRRQFLTRSGGVVLTSILFYDQSDLEFKMGPDELDIAEADLTRSHHLAG